MNKRQKDEYKRDWIATHGKYERQTYRIFKKALDGQIKNVIKSINEDGLSSAIALLPITIEPKLMNTAYIKAYELVGVSQGKWVTDWMTIFEKPIKSGIPIHSKKLLAFGSEFWRRKMREFLMIHGALKVKEVDETTINLIRRLLVKYQSQGLSVIDQARQMVKDLSNSSYNKNRALVIARTESTTAANYTSLTAGKEANYETEKEWLSIEDNRTRDSHRVANGNQVGMDEFFIVNGEEMQYPGDPNGSASNNVNCRCSVLTIPLLDSDGLPVRR